MGIAKIFFAFLLSISLNAEFLSPDKAFKAYIDEPQARSSVIIHLKLDNSIYLYDDKIKVILKLDDEEIDFTSKVSIPKPIRYRNHDVHFGGLAIQVPKVLIENFKARVKTVIFKYQGCSVNGICYSPMETSYTLKSSINVDDSDSSQSIANMLHDKNILYVLGAFFLFGLFLSFTPCIFPMIPILSSLIANHSKKSNGKISTKEGLKLSVIYVVSMSIAYTIAGVVAGLFGANVQSFFQNPIVIVSFASIFVALAFSMFGYFEFGIPASWQAKLDKIGKDNDNKKGYFSVIIMGFLSALIVGPCVAPPLAGALLYIGQTGDAVLGGLSLFVLSIGMGMPLLIIGAGAGKYMPKPGGWMIKVSNVFGFIMIGIAIYLVSRLVPEYITVLMYSALGIFFAIYVYKLDNTKNNILKIISAIMVIVVLIFALTSLTKTDNHMSKFKYITTMNELDKEIYNAKKPIMLDFWASWCVYCVKLDEVTFADPEVSAMLEDYLLLKVDVSKSTRDTKQLMKRFDVVGPPALVFWDINKKELKSKKVVGYISADKFKAVITQ